MINHQEILEDLNEAPGCDCGGVLYKIGQFFEFKNVINFNYMSSAQTFIFGMNVDHVHTIDLCYDLLRDSRKKTLFEKLEKYDMVDKVSLYEEDHKEIEKDWNKPIDVLNINIENPDQIKEIYHIWSKFVNEKGLIIIYGTMEQGEIRDFMFELDLHKINLQFCRGVAILSKSWDSVRKIEEYVSSLQESRIERIQRKRNAQAKICMISMFKNEAHSIGNMLKSVTPFIDFWVIQDNGSTDGTPEIVKEWAEYYNIPGVLYQVEEGWVGFGWNRDHLLQKAKSIDHGCQWIMKMDCDETLEVDYGFDWSLFDRLDNQSYSVPAVAPGIIYQRTWIWRADLPWRFHHDPAHETIYLDDGVTNEGYQMGILPTTFRMRAGETKGESYTIPTKYVTDSLILEEKLIREQSMLTDLYHFWYIAKSYEDAMRCETFPLGEAQRKHYSERSIFYYLQWLNYTHQFEQRDDVADRIDEMAYYSVCSIGNSYRYLGDTAKAIYYFERAEGFCPRRNDHLIYLAESYWGLRDYKKMLHYTNIMMQPERKMPYPDFVFIISTNMYYDTGTYPQQLHQIALDNQETKSTDSLFYTNLNKKKRIFVVDDFYSNVDRVREYALSQEFSSDNNWYKGQRTTGVYRPHEIKKSFEEIMGIKIKNWETHAMNGRFQYCTPQDLLVYHYDAQTWAGMIFLTPNAPYDCGTSFFASKITGARHFDQDPDTKSFAGGFYDSTKFDLVDTVGNVYNRLVLFDARCFHSASKYFGTDIQNSRLFHIFFFD